MRVREKEMVCASAASREAAKEFSPRRKAVSGQVRNCGHDPASRMLMKTEKGNAIAALVARFVSRLVLHMVAPSSSLSSPVLSTARAFAALLLFSWRDLLRPQSVLVTGGHANRGWE